MDNLLIPDWLIRLSVAAVWIYEGIWCKLLRGRPDEFAVVKAVPFYGPRFGEQFLIILGIAEASIGIWVISAVTPVICASVQTILLILLNLSGIKWSVKHIHDPAGMVIKNFAFLMLAWVAASI